MTPSLPHGTAPDLLMDGESLAGSWKSSVGVLVLTDQRAVLLVRPSRISRAWRTHWSVPLECIREVQVALKMSGSLQGRPDPVLAIPGGPITPTGSLVDTDPLNRPVWITIDGTPVYSGHPKDADPIRELINRASVSRMQLIQTAPPALDPLHA